MSLLRRINRLKSNMVFRCNVVASGNFPVYIGTSEISMSTPEAIRKRKAPGLRTVFSILLLAFYVAGAVQIEALHLLFHTNNQQISHSEAQENDPCHRSVYHQEAEKGCGHHSHIVVTGKCELCDIIAHTDSILLSTFESQAHQFLTVDFVFASPEVVFAGQTILSSRAPPVA